MTIADGGDWSAWYILYDTKDDKGEDNYFVVFPNKPILAKLTPNVAWMSPAAEAARRGGADGIAAINTIKSIIGVNPHTYISAPAVHGMSAVGGYSGNAVRPIALRFIAELGQDPNIQGMHISAMGGVETWQDALELFYSVQAVFR